MCIYQGVIGVVNAEYFLYSKEMRKVGDYEQMQQGVLSSQVPCLLNVKLKSGTIAPVSSDYVLPCSVLSHDPSR